MVKAKFYYIIWKLNYGSKTAWTIIGKYSFNINVPWPWMVYIVCCFMNYKRKPWTTNIHLIFIGIYCIKKKIEIQRNLFENLKTIICGYFWFLYCQINWVFVSAWVYHGQHEVRSIQINIVSFIFYLIVF